MAKVKKASWGGKRENQTGRPQKYNGETVVIRVPKVALPEIKAIIKKYSSL